MSQTRFTFTHKFVGAGEVEELNESEVVSRHQTEAGVRHAGAGNVGLLCVSRPDTQNLVTQNTGRQEPMTRSGFSR